MIKSIKFFNNNATATTNNTISATTLNIGDVSLGDVYTSFSKMNVLINTKTLTAGTANGFNVSIQERFSDVGYVETAKSGSITATGQYWIMRDLGSTALANRRDGFPALGTGFDKQIVFTNNTIQAMSVDVYFVFYQD